MNCTNLNALPNFFLVFFIFILRKAECLHFGIEDAMTIFSGLWDLGVFRIVIH